MRMASLTPRRHPAFRNKIVAMGINSEQRRDVVRAINAALAEYNEAAARGEFPERGMRMIRISRILANLNGAAWPA